MEKGAHKNFMKVTACVYMEVIGKIAVENSMSSDGVKIPSMLDDNLPSEVNTIKGEHAFEYRKSGTILSILIHTKSQHKSRQELCSPCVTNWCQNDTCKRRGET